MTLSLVDSSLFIWLGAKLNLDLHSLPLFLSTYFIIDFYILSSNLTYIVLAYNFKLFAGATMSFICDIDVLLRPDSIYYFYYFEGVPIVEYELLLVNLGSDNLSEVTLGQDNFCSNLSDF